MEETGKNSNRIVTDGFSKPDSEAMYHSMWQNEPETAENFYYNGKQCGGCSFYAEFDTDWGLCCHPDSRHRLETVFEHFTCPAYVDDGWGAHNFLTDENREWLKHTERQEISIIPLVIAYIKTNDLGTVSNENAYYRLHEQMHPFCLDLGFFTKDHPINMDGTTYLTAPDLAIRIVTTFDSAKELNYEVMAYLESGTCQVWVVDPLYYPIETVHVYMLTPELEFRARILTKGDTLDGGDVLPGFSVPVSTVFQWRDR